jgi:hypothetical protein
VNQILDAGARIALDSPISQFVRPFGSVPASLLAGNIASAVRADAETARGAMWLNEIDRLAGADRARRDSLVRQLAPVITGRQDSGAGLPALSGKVEIGAPILVRIQDRSDILEGIPARPVDGNASGYYRNFVKPGGTATLLRGEDTAINRVSYTWSQDLRPLHWCGVALSQGWLESRRVAQAGLDDARWKMEAVNRAIRDFWWNALVSGSTVPGLDFYSLASVPGLLRFYSSLTIGSASIGNVLTELVYVMTQAQERSPANLAPDRVIITDRLRNRLMATTAAPYSALSAWDFFTAQANGLGLQVIIGKSLRDFGGTGVDGMLFFRSEANEGLRIVKGLDVTPVHTYVDATGQVTIYASSAGGLELPYAEGCMLALFATT